ncbi:MAG: hypothetical protein KDA84_26785, partial [Planctomycetaceae bacterium]|nr:hypothetical protein [Planctomycetaceae bacterium]
ACRPVPREAIGIPSPEIQLTAGEFLPTSAHALTAEQVRCQATNSATLAQLTEMERGLAWELHDGSWCLTQNQKALEQDLLWLRTLEQGNKAASTALEIFYHLSESQQQAHNLIARRTEIESTKADLNELKAHDLPVDKDPGELDRHVLSTQEALTSLEAGMAQGWAQLQVLLGGDCPQEIPQMVVGSGILPSPPDPSLAVSIAWQSHPELRTLQMMIQRLTPETLPVARALLQQYEAGLGTAEAVGFGVQAQQLLRVFLIFLSNSCPTPSQLREMEVRKIQILELLGQREKAVAAEVETALISWKSAFLRWQSANQRLQNWQSQLGRLTEKQRVDESVTAFDLAESRMGILEAKSDCIKFAYELRQAQVKLWVAQGIVGAGCGLHSEDSCPESPSQWLQNDVPESAGPGMIVPIPAGVGSSPDIPIQSCRPLPARN